MLDTHFLIWAVATPYDLNVDVREAIASPRNDVFVSAVSAWEISIKRAKGHLTFPLDVLSDILAEMDVHVFAVDLAHAVAAGGLPRHHGDPFDRMLVAQAQAERCTLVTSDPDIRRYDVPVFGSSRA